MLYADLLVVIFLYLCLYVLVDAIHKFFSLLFLLYTQYLWPISPMQCFCRPLNIDGVLHTVCNEVDKISSSCMLLA